MLGGKLQDFASPGKAIANYLSPPKNKKLLLLQHKSALAGVGPHKIAVHLSHLRQTQRPKKSW